MHDGSLCYASSHACMDCSFSNELVTECFMQTFTKAIMPFLTIVLRSACTDDIYLNQLFHNPYNSIYKMVHMLKIYKNCIIHIKTMQIKTMQTESNRKDAYTIYSRASV